MAVICLITFFLATNIKEANSILLENINNHQQTTPAAHPDTLIFLMQEVIQLKNTVQQNAQEMNRLKTELEAGRNISIANEIRKLHAEISVMKFTFENAINDHSSSHLVSETNLTGVMAKLHTMENGFRQLTLALNEKVSNVQMTRHNVQMNALLNNISNRVHAVENEKVSNKQMNALLKNISYRVHSLENEKQIVSQISNHESSLDAMMHNLTERVHSLEYDKVLPGRIRLVNGSTIWMGRVEVSYNGTWATVPGLRHDGYRYTFDDKAAQVVCRMLGYPTKNAAAIHEISPLHFGKGSGHVDMSLYGLHCTGRESSLYQCSKTTDPNPFQVHYYDAGVACMDIRLAGGSSPMNGRVEVNLGEGWGTVCDDGWDNNDARVVCRMLGYHGSAQGLQGTPTTGGKGTIWLDDLNCTGSETSLVQCKMNPIGIGFANCNHDKEDARVVCQAYLFHNVIHGTNAMAVISLITFFLATNIIVANCILLENINNHEQTTPAAHPNTLFFLMQELIQLKNTVKQNAQEMNRLKTELEAGRNISVANEINKLHAEISVMKFTFENAINDHSSSHLVSETNLTGVMAKLHTMENGFRQLTLALNEKVSNVQMTSHNVQMNALLNNISNRVHAVENEKVSNKQMNALLKNISYRVHALENEKQIVSQISNHESSLDAMMHNLTERVHSLEYDKVLPGRIRLVNGSTSWMGRVEVSYNGTWATVPGYRYTYGVHNFDDKAAQVVCRMLGYPTKNAAAIYESSPVYFGKGSGPVAMTLFGIYCTGHESSLYECNKTTDANLIQAHKFDAGVACMDIRLAGGSSPMNGRVEVNLGGGWGTVCDNGWDDNEAQVVCRMLGYNGSAQGLKGSSTTGGKGTIWMDDLECTGGETSLVQCKMSLYGINFSGCRHYKDARVVCHA
ncbi:scavenger receptor cysteine-rich type 1 protein M130-like [Saccostrea cucullata]|uniref:scavenger receptor cysteine-rich type 1 protein M130-like n=1 Tax=Saccostrea cuccullata TaxID=36930 RepID=UPI002ECFC935